ncbi:uncharacterized protein ALTATR162_LOCUS4357 [Alternaria atra]|uniref:Uncharacterized protein n=1 Tax=Alternaria atra TaxID=119953 RepID=A0A8J2I5G0_9PLEO|nr:uncharacterized protein ALTATR162_LOCUS4357 [Alternaria atra]CAG5156560.1 unnamed protein product [Alternaria atra]
MATLSLTTEWAKACYADQLANYPPDNLATQLIIILDELISSQTSPTASACTTATLVEAQHDISLALANLIGFFFSAAESNTSLDALNLLVAYLVELTKQPDAINSSSETKIWDAGGGEIYEIPPGAPIIGEAKRLWRELPMFSWNVTEMFQVCQFTVSLFITDCWNTNTQDLNYGLTITRNQRQQKSLQQSGNI